MILPMSAKVATMSKSKNRSRVTDDMHPPMSLLVCSCKWNIFEKLPIFPGVILP